MVNNLLLAMSVLSQSADLVTNMKEEREINLALNARPDLKGLKVPIIKIVSHFDLGKIKKRSFNLILIISGSPRVDGDEEEDEFDDLDNEFDLPHSDSEAMLSSRLNIGTNVSGFATPSDAYGVNPEIPRLTYGQEVINYILISVISQD